MKVFNEDLDFSFKKFSYNQPNFIRAINFNLIKMDKYIPQANNMF